jgi:type II secretory pathway component PulK
MIVIVMVTLAGLSFVWTLSTENKATHLHGDQMQLGQALISGQEYLRAVCSGSLQQREERGDLSDNETMFRQVLMDCDAEGLRGARISVLSPRAGERGSTGYRFGLQDESAKLNLAVLQRWERAEPGAAEAALMNLPGMTESTAAAILDWIDPDTTARPSGAEADYYTGRGLPYVPRDGVPASLEELLLVRDVGRYQLLGADADMNYTIESGEMQVASASPAAASPATESPWATMLTMYSAERNATFDGQPRINLNEEDLESLYDKLTEAFDRERAAFVIAYRQFGPHDAGGAGGDVDSRRKASPRSPRRSPGSSRSPRRGETDRWFDLSLPAEFEVESVFDLVGAQVLVPPKEDREGGRGSKKRSVSRRRRTPRTTEPDQSEAEAEPEEEPEEEPLIVDSPFESDPAAMRDYLAELLDLTTVDVQPVFRGRINVHLAPREVLASLPGIQQDTVDRILSARLSHVSSDRTVAWRHATWLLTEETVDLAQMKALAPYVTGGGDVFRGQIVAVLDDSPLTARAEVVIDSTATPPRQVYWKDLGLLGPGFPAEVVGASSLAGD